MKINLIIFKNILKIRKKKRISEIEEEIRLLVQNDDKITKSTSLNKSN